MSDAGAGFSLGESLVEWPMAATAVCKFAQALQWKSLVLCGKLSDPSFALQAKNQGGGTSKSTTRSHIARIRTGLLFQDISPFTCSLLLAA